MTYSVWHPHDWRTTNSAASRIWTGTRLSEPVHRPGEKHDARVAVFDEVLDSLASAAFVIAQYTVNSSFFEDVVYEDDGQVCVAQLEDKARTAGVTLPNTRLAGSTKPCL